MIWAIYIFLDALINWWWIEHKRQVPNYIVLTITRGWFLIIVGILYDINEFNIGWWMLFCTTSFWVMFDPTLNIMRNLNVFYIGTNSKIDSIGLRYPVLYWIAKVIALILVVISVNKLWIK
jgi:hypothetical protein